MNKSGRIALTTIIVLVLGFGFIFLGIMIGRSGWIPQVSRMYSDRRAMPFNISENYYA